VVKNAAALANALIKRGYTLVSNGTSNHLMLVDIRPQGIDGARAELVLEKASITVNKNAVPGDTKPFVPGGLRLGTPALTTRGFVESDFEKVAEFIDKGLKITATITQEGSNASKLADFKACVASKEYPLITALRKEVEEYANKFPMPTSLYLSPK